MSDDMKMLIITGCAKDIFIYNMAKWLKSSMDVDIDVFEFYPCENGAFDTRYYNGCYEAKGINIRYIHRYLNDFVKSSSLKSFLGGRYYDIIQCHWIVSPLVITPGIKKHCKKLALTFWGGELQEMRLLRSNGLYLYFLNRFVKQVDCIIGSRVTCERIAGVFHLFKGIYRFGQLGSSPLDSLYDLMTKEEKTQSKAKMGIPESKITVLVGYSGKLLHQHIPIINELSAQEGLKSKIHILAPMTRGATKDYINEVKKELDSSGFSYSLLSDRYLSDEEIARLRNATDITLQLSSFDSFSRSIIECFCARSIVVYGSWLNYSNHLQINKFVGIEVKSLVEGVRIVEQVVNHLHDYDEMVNNNFEQGKHQYRWSECIKDWVSTYNELLK